MSSHSPRLETPLQATLAGIRDRFGGGPRLELSDDERLDGLTTLITGANRGLGFGIAQHLAPRGGRLLMACRSGGPEAALSIGHGAEALPLDLADSGSIDTLVQTLVARELTLDRLVLNAGSVTLGSKQTGAGLDQMFHVNFLANVELVEQLLAADRLAHGARIIVVSSESHRSGEPTLDGFGVPRTYGTSGVMPAYGQAKLYLTTYAQQLARRLPSERVGVFTICPGAVASDIAREAPGWMKVLLRPTMKLLFQSPYRAAEPVAWLVCARELEGRTAVYHHMHTEKPPADFAVDPATGEALLEQSVALIERACRPSGSPE